MLCPSRRRRVASQLLAADDRLHYDVERELHVDHNGTSSLLSVRIPVVTLIYVVVNNRSLSLLLILCPCVKLSSLILFVTFEANVFMDGLSHCSVTEKLVSRDGPRGLAKVGLD